MVHTFMFYRLSWLFTLYGVSCIIFLQIWFGTCASAEREAVNAAERAERKQQLREKVSIVLFLFLIHAHNKIIAVTNLSI